MLTADSYTVITGDAAPAGFDALRDLVVARLERVLGRGLASQERTEWLAVYADGVAYPWAYPVTATDQGSARDNRVHLGRGQVREVELTYTGGFTAETCPVDLAAAVAWGIHTVRHPVQAEIPDGVTNLSIAGEYSVTREAGTSLGADGESVPAWAHSIRDLGGRCATLAAAYRTIR